MLHSKTVIISTEDDAHIPFVTRHLHNAPIVIDTQSIIDGTELSYHFSDKRLNISYKGRDITETRGVWLRKPAIPTLWRLPVPAPYKDYAQSALLETLNCLYTAFPKAIWVSNHYAILKANNKPFQQTLATSLGFCTPETLYTSDSLKARRFIEKHGTVIVKSLSNYHGKNEAGQVLVFFTRKVTRDENIDLNGLRVAPGVFQEMIEVGFELRVTVVKNTVFAARIHLSGQTNEKVRDWRLGHFEGDIDFEAYQLDPLTRQRCIELVARLGLKYGAIDIICDKKGISWFLEINANGQWAFIEKATQQPIGKAIAECLEGYDI